MPNLSGDAIQIEELELSAFVGVPEEERAQRQRLTVTMTLWPLSGFGEMGDEISNAVNYAAVCGEVESFVSGRADKLIETLADAIGSHLLWTFPLRGVRIELRKFVLPNTRFVAAICERVATNRA